MKKTCLSILFLICFAFAISSATAQEYKPGFIILNDGTRIGGTIAISDNAPWYNQRFIFIKDSTNLAANPGKDVKAKKYVADDMKFYKVGDRKFEKVHFVDLQNLQLKSLGSNDHMMERLSGGRINVYRFYTYPKDVEISMGTAEDLRQQEKKDHNELLNNWKMLTSKDASSKLIDAFDYDLQKYFEDTPDVLTKYQQGGYGNEPISTAKGLAAKMVAMAKKKAYGHLNYQYTVAAFDDYNTKNGGLK